MSLLPSFTRRSSALLTLPLLASAWMAGCSWTPRPVMPSTLDITVTASADANPDTQGRGAPVMVRIYELRTSDAFERAEFFALNDKDQAVLGSDLVHREEFVLQPGQSRVIARKASNDTRVIGMTAAYRAIDTSIWRAMAPVEPPAEAGRIFSGQPLEVHLTAAIGPKGVSLYRKASENRGFSTPNLPVLNLPLIGRP